MTTTAIAHPERGHDGAAYPWAVKTATGRDDTTDTDYTIHLGPEHLIQGIDRPMTVAVQHDGRPNQKPYLFLDAFGPATPDNARDYAAFLLYTAAQAENSDTAWCCTITDNCPHIAQTEAAATRDIANIVKNGNAVDIMRRIANAAHHRHNGHNKPAN